MNPQNEAAQTSKPDKCVQGVCEVSGPESLAERARPVRKRPDSVVRASSCNAGTESNTRLQGSSRPQAFKVEFTAILRAMLQSGKAVSTQIVGPIVRAAHMSTNCKNRCKVQAA